MFTVSVAEMRAADQYTIAKGTPSKELMRRAARGVFDSYSGWDKGRTLIVCGPGNNGGDGYALASIMKDHGLDVTLLRIGNKFSEDGAYYYGQCSEKLIPVLIYGTDPIDFSSFRVIVDCMLGTGFQGIPLEQMALVIRDINNARETSGVYVISVDINSGMNGDTGEAEIAVESDLTVSIGYYKNGFISENARKLIGKLVNIDIGIELP